MRVTADSKAEGITGASGPDYSIYCDFKVRAHTAHRPISMNNFHERSQTIPALRIHSLVQVVICCTHVHACAYRPVAQLVSGTWDYGQTQAFEVTNTEWHTRSLRYTAAEVGNKDSIGEL